jgi:hypothetical protein
VDGGGEKGFGGLCARRQCQSKFSLRKRGYAVIRERVGAGDSVYRISDVTAHRGDRTVQQRNAMDGRGPKRMAMQAA